jgi:LuxR family maltose regulon positive regulatory protein
LRVLERAVTLARFMAQPLVLARTLRYLAATLDELGRHPEARTAAGEAKAVLAASVDPSTVAGSNAPVPPVRRRRGEPPYEQLTSRELTVLGLLAGELSEAEIARQLFVSHSTVHTHARAIYRKLGASSRRQAVQRATHAGYL